jgi:hypothetical protein
VRFRYTVSISSVVTCDPGAPDKCEYNYTATTAVQQQRLNPQGNPVGQWRPFPGRNIFILKFTVHDDVNHSETPARVDQTSVTFGLYRPNAPTMENVKVSLVLTVSNAGNARFEFDETVLLCVPKGAAPACA